MNRDPRDPGFEIGTGPAVHRKINLLQNFTIEVVRAVGRPALFGVARELELPILYIGTGETMNDLVKFDPHDFVDTIVDEIYA